MFGADFFKFNKVLSFVVSQISQGKNNSTSWGFISLYTKFGLQSLSTKSCFTLCFSWTILASRPYQKTSTHRRLHQYLHVSSSAPPKPQKKGYKDHKGFKGSCHFSSMMLSKSFKPIILDSVIAQEY